MMYGIIYRAYLKDGRSYVGQTVRSLRERINVHKSVAKNINTHFANAMKKYGVDAFKWEVLQKCPDQKSLDAAERQWIKHYDSVKSGFNLKSGGSYGKHSAATKEKIRQSKLGEKNPQYGKPSWNSGKKLSKEHCDNLSKSHMGQAAWNKGLPKEQQPGYGKKCSEVRKQKISRANSGEKNGMATMTLQVAEAIKRDYRTGKFTQKELCFRYGVSQYQVWSVVNNKRWKNA